MSPTESTPSSASADAQLAPAPRAPSLRERKRERTRKAIVEAGFELFASRGYDETTVADIAEAAEIGARTFFSYFASKEELLFPERDARVLAALAAIRSRTAGERPVDVLLRALRSVGTDPIGGMAGSRAALRTRFIREVPVVRGRALQIQFEAQREIAALLQEAFPAELDRVSAAALVGAFIGAVSGALDALLEESGRPVAASQADPRAADDRPEAGEAGDSISSALTRAVELALRPWDPPHRQPSDPSVP